METFGQRLKRILEMREMSNGELARRVGKSAAYISLIVNGKRLVDKLPNYDDLRAMAKALDVPIEVLAGDDDAPVEELPEIQTVPLAELLRRIGARPAYGQQAEGITASAGRKRAKLPEGYDDSRERKMRGGHIHERIQLIEVEGECMKDILYPGDLVHVDTQQTPAIGDVVAAVRFHSETIVKFLREKDGHQYFASNDGKIIVPLDQYTRILGKVVDVQVSINRLLAVH